MVGPSSAERFYMDQQDLQRRQVWAAGSPKDDKDPDDGISAVFAAFRTGEENIVVQTWELEATLRTFNDMTHHPIDLNLGGAVTIMASLSTQLSSTSHPQWGNGALETVVWWYLMDSLDGQTWHNVALGGLFHPTTATPATASARVTAPVGLHLRFSLLPMVMSNNGNTRVKAEGYLVEKLVVPSEVSLRLLVRGV